MPEAAAGFDAVDVMPGNDAGAADAAIMVMEVFAVLAVEARD